MSGKPGDVRCSTVRAIAFNAPLGAMRATNDSSSRRNSARENSASTKLASARSYSSLMWTHDVRAFASRAAFRANANARSRNSPRSDSASAADRPHPDERLVDHVFHLRIGREPILHARLETAVRARPGAELPRPFTRNLREHVETSAHVRAALGVVRARGEHGSGPPKAPLNVRVVQIAHCVSELAGGIGADLAQREKRRIPIERGVLDPFRRGGTALLLEAEDERIARGDLLAVER